MAENLVINPPSADELNAAVNLIVFGGDTMVIDTDDLREIAIDEIANAKAMIDRSEETRTSIVKPLNEVVARVNALFKPGRERLESFITGRKMSVLTYDKSVREKAEAEQRARNAVIAQERARLAAEEQRKAEEAVLAEKAVREAAERAANLRVAAELAEREGSKKQAAAAQKAADAAAQEAAQADAAAAVIVAERDSLALTSAMITAPVVDGTQKKKGTVERWTWELDDLHEAVTFVSANPAFLSVLCVDSKAMNGMATAMKDTFPVKGIRVFSVDGLAVRKK